MAQRKRLVDSLCTQLGPCVRLAPKAQVVLRRVQRIYFLNESQNLRTFLATERGVMRYPKYEVHKRRPAFADRHQLLQYEASLQQAAKLDQALEVGACS